MISPIRNTIHGRGISLLKWWKTPCFLFLAFAFANVRAYSQSQPATLTPAIISDTSVSGSPWEGPAREALARARTSVERLFAHSADMICTESVNQTILDNEGRMAYQEHSMFNYRLQTDTGGKSLKFVESREKVEAAFRDPNRTVLITDGFGNLLLILHPEYQASYTFEAEGDDVAAGVNTLKLNFKAVPGAASPVMLQVRGQNYSVDLDGTVWIEPQSGNIVKLIAFSSSSMDELGVHSMRSEIEYQSTELHSPEESYWLPASAIIDVETAHRHWRNIHRFTAYKRFQVTAPTEERASNLDSAGKEK
jgi:hypothetical protein